ncbi:AraC family transcriptional regulator [Pseudodesulfovibrio senegalensis]|jgi:AraC family transcriptional regulator|uniref:AraC family transcriptional regulator n=1 Tax=Pseudodesulfovibrio senegalensis TaxID=1721087 RepID=A0A6N6N1L8_9BACT|nr:AraC family transcriptional regulator [Pseudodesulfovibrio senegalensis]
MRTARSTTFRKIENVIKTVRQKRTPGAKKAHKQTGATVQQQLTLHQRMSDALCYIQASLDQAIDPEQVAARACFSLSHFHRIFKGMVGETLGEHIRRLRLERAAVQLAYGDAQVTGIAFDAGYETLESFSRAFRKMFGQAPSKFRKTNQRFLFPETPSGIHYSPGTQLSIEDPVRNEKPLKLGTTDFGPQRVAYIRHTGPYFECTAAWERLCAWAQGNNVLREDTLFLGICYDDPTITPENKIRYDACITIPKGIGPENDVTIKELPACEYLTATHYGPYEKMEETYTQMMWQWLPASGRDVPDQPSLEIYRNTLEQVSAEELVTDIYVPLA